MSDDNPPQNPPVKSFLDTIRELYPDEFSNKPLTLQKQLREMDEIIGVEKSFLDNPDLNLSGKHDESADQDTKEKYARYRDNKEWLNED